MEIRKAKKIIKEFLKKTTLDIDFDIKEEKDALLIDLRSEEAQVLIGQGGKMLSELQMILGRILRKQLDEQIYLHVDINQYKANKEKYLKELAKETADKVALGRKEQILFPMNSFERRVVHMELAEREEIKTESIGSGLDRRVIIRPA